MGYMEDVTHWIQQLHACDEDAAQAIWQEYFEKLVRLARRRLERFPRRAADEEDVALSAMNSFFRGAKAGRFPQLSDRHDLWKLLVTITIRKAHGQLKRHHAEKRGGGRLRGESVFMHGDGEDSQHGIEQVLSSEPTPEFAAMMSEICADLLDQLEDDTLRKIVTLKLDGYTNEEVAQELDCVVRTVERKLARIRDKWGRAV